ncbi:MAG: hypothetical protein ACE14V_07945 [bacterium]
MRIFISILAGVCSCCPLCILKRKFPNSKYATTMNRVERFCPFCKAYYKIKCNYASRTVKI